MLPAEPANIEREGIVMVMGLGFFAANLARLADNPAPANGGAKQVASVNLGSANAVRSIFNQKRIAPGQRCRPRLIFLLPLGIGWLALVAGGARLAVSGCCAIRAPIPAPPDLRLSRHKLHPARATPRRVAARGSGMHDHAASMQISAKRTSLFIKQKVD